MLITILGIGLTSCEKYVDHRPEFEVLSSQLTTDLFRTEGVYVTKIKIYAKHKISGISQNTPDDKIRTRNKLYTTEDINVYEYQSYSTVCPLIKTYDVEINSYNGQTIYYDVNGVDHNKLPEVGNSIREIY